jgi:hypothetical protein
VRVWITQTITAAMSASPKPQWRRSPVHDARQPRVGHEGRGLGPAHPHRVLHRPLEEVAHEQQHDEVEQERGDDLVHAQPHLEERRPEEEEPPRQHRRQRRERQDERASERAGAEDDGDDRARVELRLGPDVPELRAEGDGHGEAGEDERRRAVQRLEQRKAGARGAR